MFLPVNPYQVFQSSKTPAGLYARQKWLGQQSTQTWKTDFENTVKKIRAGQLPDGSWEESAMSTIRHLFELHLTIRERTAFVNSGLEWLIERCEKNFPRKIVSTKWGSNNNASNRLPFHKGCSGFFLYSATLFLSSVFGMDADCRILSMYKWFDELGIKRSGKWCGWSCSSNILRAFIVHPEYAHHLSVKLFVQSLQEIQDESGKWGKGILFYQTLNALAHIRTFEVDGQLEKAFKWISQSQNRGGTWGTKGSEWNTFLVIHALKNKGIL
ncbi:MAG: hypothetical protein JW932_09325 [Deltaproteobacteria bacterium]|nr:hypothetical protein [Deltaproteobacteria bacterium]